MASVVRLPLSRLCKCVLTHQRVNNPINFYLLQVHNQIRNYSASLEDQKAFGNLASDTKPNISNIVKPLNVTLYSDDGKVTEFSECFEKKMVLEKQQPLQPFEELSNNSEQAESADMNAAEFIDNLAPPTPVSYNVAASVNQSETLKKLVDLGVDLSRVEENPHRAKFIMKLDFEKDMKNHIQLLHDNGVTADILGDFITKNPLIFKESLEDIQIRINYLMSKKFSDSAISRIISRNPYYLTTLTKNVDFRLGFLQKTFSLSGDEVRFLITKCPNIVSYSFEKLREKLFVIKEEMGFSGDEMKRLLLMKPKVYMLGRKVLTERFDIVHNRMGMSHERILQYPGILLKRGFLLKQRHEYLVHIGRAQYDHTKPGFVSLVDIATTTDHAFCKKCAHTSTDAYNDFLKTM